jgi:hypothetical protein
VFQTQIFWPGHTILASPDENPLPKLLDMLAVNLVTDLMCFRLPESLARSLVAEALGGALRRLERQG